MRKPQLPPGTIPAGATHFYHNPERDQVSTSPWRKCVEGQWYMHKETRWEKVSSSKVNLFVEIAAVLKQEKEWTGEGEPPIGSLVEFDMGGGNWATVTVFAIKEGTLHQVDVLFDGPEGWGVISMGSPRLRPVKSVEEREMESVLSDMRALYEEGGALRLYDAGYRKQEKSV